jgi:hypothetical protein
VSDEREIFIGDVRSTVCERASNRYQPQYLYGRSGNSGPRGPARSRVISCTQRQLAAQRNTSSRRFQVRINKTTCGATDVSETTDEH